MTEKEFFEKNRCYKITSEGSINTRCPFCGDSQKPHHLYNYGQAYLFPDGFFKCFRCGKYTTAKDAIIQIANNLGIEPPKELLDKFKVTAIKYVNKSSSEYTYYEPTENDLQEYKQKVKYLEKRVNENITLSFLKQNKIILNLDPYYEQINKKLKSFYPNKYVGFMSYNNKKIVLRKIDDSFNGIRYVNVNISNEFDFWTQQNFIEKIYKTRTVVISEGIFDVLNRETQTLFGKEYVYASSLSKGNFVSTIIKMFSESLIKLNIILLKDSDVPIEYIRYIYKRVKELCISFKVYQNLNGKDFGEQNIIPDLVFKK